ncbi:DUF3488 and transglutaminase-like domain-containing protein [Tepidicella baoligensis]|uniref:transglutaminase family protein n=1 Tax=Tepidicella baoligensis TaxID=2707016 RepID=UPI0031B63E16
MRIANSRLWQPGTLPRETRDTLFLLGVIGWIVALQSPHIPLWCTVMTSMVLLWRGWLAVGARSLPGWPWRLALLVGATAGTFSSHQTILGHEAGVTLIVVLLALKTLELRARRDAFVIFFLGFFTLLTHFFYSQTLLTALGILLAFLGLLTGLVLAHMPVGHPPLWRAARLAGGMALLGAPIMLVLFMLFPRFAPLWGIPTDSGFGRSGLSGEMQVGQIARLALDDSIAFRVEFEDGRRPAQDQLYFRGPVMSVFDGLQWRPRPRTPLATPMPPLDILDTAEAIRYRLTQEPSNRPWVMTLEATPSLPPIAGQQARLSPELEWTVDRPLTDVTRFDAVAHPHFRHGPAQRDATLLPDLELPGGFNPRTLQLAQDLRRELDHTPEPEPYIDAVLQRLRTGGYAYTLEPGLYGRHTADEFWFDRRAGFCEHIASSFVILMRALDIPARVVTGYHGGEINPVDGVWTVRQSDAHAWAEVWLPSRGWTRIDPTAYVAPARTTELSRLRPPPGLVANAMLRIHPDLLWQVRAFWEATNNRWNQWVLNYTSSRQMDLLRQLGFSSPSWTDLFHLMIGALVFASLLGAAWTAWSHARHDPWLRLLHRARARLQQAGLELPPQATPRQMATQLTGPQAHAEALQRWRDWLLALEVQRYDPSSTIRLAALRRDFRRLPALPALPPLANPTP